MSNLYQIYHESASNLAATMVFKDEATCQIINGRLSTLSIDVNDADPKTWKYYLNLNGQYHTTDKMMRVTSMDTREVIDFTRENMDIHRDTWRAYQYGSRYYNELITMYPKQDMLIHGILNPVDIDAAIAAPDHTILYYDTSLVEARETNLIPKIQEMAYGLFIRWAQDDYRINNSLFVAARLAIFFMALPGIIKGIRTGNCHTPFVHSYHIQRYLASFGPLDQYYAHMNDFQRLYFYKNIRNILLNNGKDEVFQNLVNKTLTARKFPLARYTLQHNDDTLLENLDPAIQYERTSVNGLHSALGLDIKNTEQMLELEASLTRSNAKETGFALDYIPAKAVRSLSAELGTKVLESNMVDMKESEPYTLADVLLNQWIYFADTGAYRYIVPLQLPNGGDSFKLTTKEAYIVYQYLYMKRMGVNMDVIPQISAKRVIRPEPPTLEELRTVSTKAITPTAFLTHAMKGAIRPSTYVSVDAFLETCLKIQTQMLLHRDLYVYRNDLFQYAELQLATGRFYADIPVDMDHGQDYNKWLRTRGLSFEGYTPLELDEIMMSIINQVTGLKLRTSLTLEDVQKAMLGIMSQLSSYNVQFVQKINQSAVVMFDWGHVRWHYSGGTAKHVLRLPATLALPMELYGRAKLYQAIDVSGVTIRALDQRSSHELSMEIGVDFALSGINQRFASAINLGVNVDMVVPDVIDLSIYNGKDAIIPQPVPKSISDLFLRTSTDDFVSIR